jgi:hypothetical protein
MKNIDYQLRQFVKVATHKSLSEAAIALNVTQSALSKQLREIELTVGHRVFRRHGRGIELTEQGNTLWRAVQAAYKLVDTTIDQLQAICSRTAGTLRVATLHGRSHAVVNELVVTVLGKRPDINLTMMEGSAIDVCRLVESGIADVGFVEHTSTIPDTLEISGPVESTYESADIDRASQVLGAIACGKIPVTRIACHSGIEGNDVQQKTESEKRVSAPIVVSSAPVDPEEGPLQPNYSEVADNCRRLVAITRKAERSV